MASFGHSGRQSPQAVHSSVIFIAMICSPLNQRDADARFLSRIVDKYICSGQPRKQKCSTSLDLFSRFEMPCASVAKDNQRIDTSRPY